MIFCFTGNALEDLNLDEPLNLAASLDKDLETDSPTVSNSISAGLASSGKYILSNIGIELIYISYRKSNKMLQCIKILFHIYVKLNMFRVTQSPSSGA
jgi:hypothetical protein